uniref:Uncharacterized protein n=1 Tax=Scleropages formosus TaxID=113540 RepID=A0A8C9RVV5_SCLFO
MSFSFFFPFKSHVLNYTECSFFIKVIGRDGFEEFYPRMWKNIQDKRRLMKTCTDQKIRWEGKNERKNGQIEALAK